MADKMTQSSSRDNVYRQTDGVACRSAANRSNRNTTGLRSAAFVLLAILCPVLAAGCAQFEHHGAAKSCATCGPTPGVALLPPDATVDAGVAFPEAQPPRQSRPAALSLQMKAPRNMQAGAQITYDMQVKNTGGADATNVVLRAVVPAGLTFADSVPPARAEPQYEGGQTLIWELGTLRAGADQRVQATFRVDGTGRLLTRAEVTAAESLRADATAATDVTKAQLRLEITGPTEAAVGQSVTFDITLFNDGNTDATNILLTDVFDDGFVFDFTSPEGVPEERTDRLTVNLRRLEAGKSHRLPLTLRGTRGGALRNQVIVTADGGIEVSKEVVVKFGAAGVSVNVTGPRWRFLGRPAEFNIAVTNTGDAPLSGVRIVDQFPEELMYSSASRGGMYRADQVDWEIGDLQPGQTARVQIELRGEQVAQSVINRVLVTADGGVQASAQDALEIRPRPAGLNTYMFDQNDLVAEGEEIVYEIRVENTGDVDARNVAIQVEAPAEIQLVEGAHEAPAALSIDPIRKNRVIFGPADLPANEQWVIKVHARALKATPAAVFRMQVSGAGIEKPIIEQEPTTIIPRQQ